MRTATCLVAFSVVVGILGLTPDAPAAETSLSMWSDPGDYIGGGQTYFYDTSTGTFTPGGSGNSAHVSYMESGFNHWWYLDFSAPGSEPLSVGTYQGATRYPFQDADEPGLSVSGDGRGCNQLTGTFAVKQVQFSSGTLVSYWALFDQHCEGVTPALHGEIRYNVEVVVALRAPLVKAVEKGETLSFDVTATDAQGRHVTLSASGLPEGAEFVDHGDNTGTFRWTPPFSATGSLAITFTGDNGEGGTDSTQTLVEVQGVTSLLLDSEPGDYIGAGEVQFFTREDGYFLGSSSANQAEVSYSDDHWWYLDFAAPSGETLSVGPYTGATRYPFQDPSEPGLSVYGDGRGCNTLTGEFEIKQIEPGPNGSLGVFWATFVQHCEGQTPALRGEIRLNADVPVLVKAPSSLRTGAGIPLSLEVRGLAAAEGPVTLTAADLPQGAAFVDHGDSRGTFTWTPDSSQIGSHRVRFSATDTQGNVDQVPTAIVVTVQNDDFDHATEVSSLPFLETSNLSQATRASDDPDCGFGSTIWYVLTLPEDTDLDVGASSGPYYQTVGVFTGERGNLSPIACGDTRHALHALAGVTYHIEVITYSQEPVTLSVRVAPPAPVNDDFDGALPILSFPFLDTQDTSHGTLAVDDPQGCAGDQTVWYVLAPSEDVRVTAQVTGAWASYIGAYTGDRGSLSAITCEQRITFTARAGTVYHFMVSSFGLGGEITFEVQGVPPLAVDATVDPAGTVVPRSGEATLRGTLVCSRPVWTHLDAALRQRKGRAILTATREADLWCSGTTPWSLQMTSENGLFSAGPASASVEVHAFDGDTGEADTDAWSGDVNLKGKK